MIFYSIKIAKKMKPSNVCITVPIDGSPTVEPATVEPRHTSPPHLSLPTLELPTVELPTIEPHVKTN